MDGILTWTDSVHISNLLLPWVDFGLLGAFAVGIAHRMTIPGLIYFTAAFFVLMAVWILDGIVFWMHLQYQTSHWAFAPLIMLFPLEVVEHVFFVVIMIYHLRHVMPS